MIIAKEGVVRTPIEQLLLNEMEEDDMNSIMREESEIDAIIDSSTDKGLFNNTISGDGLEHIDDLEDADYLF
jgi:hypothetical protein